MAKAGSSATEEATPFSEPLPKCSPTSVKGSEPRDSAGPEEPQPVNDHRQQQLMLYQQQCDFLKRQIQLMEEQHGSLAALGNQAQLQLLPGAAGSAGNDVVLAAQCAAPAGSPTGQQLTGVCLQHTPSGVHMQAGAGSGVWAQGSFASSACAPVTRSGSSISTTTNALFHAGSASMGMLSSPMALQHTISSPSSMLASSSPMGVSGCPHSEPMAGWMPPCSSMTHMESGDSSFWQQAMQQPMYTPQQSLASMPAGVSAPLPAWCGVAGQQVVPCGAYSNSPLQQLPSPGVAAAQPTPLIIVGASHEADEDVDMDSAETIAGEGFSQMRVCLSFCKIYPCLYHLLLGQLQVAPRMRSTAECILPAYKESSRSDLISQGTLYWEYCMQQIWLL